MDIKFLITEYQKQKMGFLYENNSLVEVHSFSDDMIGNIYVARVENILENINAAFISISEDENCYYSLKDNVNHIFLNNKNTSKINVGDLLLVQISRNGVKGKKNEATSDITLKGKTVIINRKGVVGLSKKIIDPNIKEILKGAVKDVICSYNCKDKNVGAIIRTTAVNYDICDIEAEARDLLNEFENVIDKSQYMPAHTLVYKSNKAYLDFIDELLEKRKNDDISVVTDDEEIYKNLTCIKSKLKSIDLFKDNMTTLVNIYGINKELERSMSKKVFLKSGGYLYVEPTEALTVIDVNTGKSIKGSNAENHILKINIEAAEKIASLLRIRNLSGIIIIDFINMSAQESVQLLVDHLKNELAKDSVKCTYIDITPLGLVEITRKKTTKPLHEIIK